MFAVVQQEFYNYLGERGWDTTLLHGSGKTLRSAIESAEKTVLERFDERLSEVSDIDDVTDDVTDEGWTTLLQIWHPHTCAALYQGCLEKMSASWFSLRIPRRHIC